jgi:hypothetical protein
MGDGEELGTPNQRDGEKTRELESTSVCIMYLMAPGINFG